MKLSEIIKELNKENTPPGGWKPEDKVSSSQAGGPAPKESGCKHAIKKPQMIFKTILEFEKDE